MVDRYTKAVLTVIAAALVMIAARGLVPAAQAQAGGVSHVIIDRVASYAFQYAGPLDVRTQ